MNYDMAEDHGQRILFRKLEALQQDICRPQVWKYP